MSTPDCFTGFETEEVSPINRQFVQTSKAAASVVVSIGLLGFCGWVFHVPILTTIRPTYVSMKFNTSVQFLCLGVALWMAGDDARQRNRQILGLAVTLVAGLTLAEYAFHTSLGIDQFFFRDMQAKVTDFPGRMAVVTGICFLLLGLAVAFLGQKRALVLQQTGVLVCLAFSLVTLCGYVYGVESLYSIEAFGSMSLPTDIAFIAACFAYFLARPHHGIMSVGASNSEAGLLLRRLIPALIIVPITLGWLRVQGQRANFYGTQFGISLQVLGNIVCLTTLTLLISRSMFRFERERESAKQALQAREDLLKIFVKNVQAGVAMFDREMRYLAVSDRWCADYGVDSSNILGRLHYELFPDIPDRWKDFNRRALAGETIHADEDRWDREDGGTMWVRWEVRPWLNLNGSPGGILILAEDITQRKQMEASLSDMSRRLIDAHEEERARIARELHDDINQRLALLAVNLQTLKEDLPTLEEKASHQIDEICESVMNLGNDIQALSRRLHSSKLEYLGLVASANSFCKEFSMRHGVETTFHSDDIPTDIPVEVALCFFRVLQESLQNAVKHSGVKRFEVSLRGGLHDIDLIVHDSGRGFDLDRAMKEHGLGLTSMRERLKLANGELFIESKPELGTTIRAHVPLRHKVKSAEANG